jgi:glutamyl-tRNA synthetase
MAQHRTRLAPSPTGALHLGNARTFLVTWALARQQGWQIVMRIEDLDGPRIKAGAAEESLELLTWLGLDWDEGPFYQLADLKPYEEALSRLSEGGDIYTCTCTRKQIEAAALSAPHGDEHELRYPGTCRPQNFVQLSDEQMLRRDVVVRFRVPKGVISYVDTFAGRQEFDVQQTIGDFLVRTKQGLPSYQLAVVVDDARQQIDQVVRGDDLLSSTPRQMLLYDKLQLEPRPGYTHLPLVVGADRKRLAKRHGDSRLSHYREQGVRAERVIGLLAEWSGLGNRQEMSANEFLDSFNLAAMSANPSVFTDQDDAWLLESVEQ